MSSVHVLSISVKNKKMIEDDDAEYEQVEDSELSDIDKQSGLFSPEDIDPSKEGWQIKLTFAQCPVKLDTKGIPVNLAQYLNNDWGQDMQKLLTLGFVGLISVVFQREGNNVKAIINHSSSCAETFFSPEVLTLFNKPRYEPETLISFLNIQRIL